MHIIPNYSLQQLNSFGLQIKADFYTELYNLADIQVFVKSRLKDFERFLLLGGGSNVLFLNDFHGLVIAIKNKGIALKQLNDQKFLITVQAGESWEYLVDYCTDLGLCGLQNMAMIPGNAGSAPIQNIGAYGVEIKDVFHSLEGLNLETGKLETFYKNECQFAYRDSIFKRELKGKFLITSLTLELMTHQKPDISYKALKEELDKSGITEPGIVEVRDIIKNIRRSKLPDPSIIGNAGSFFKNPVVSHALFDDILVKFPDLVSYQQGDGRVKLPAAWLIEKCGWKGKRKGDAGVHEKQALVLVNYGTATGNDILKLADEIKLSVFEVFGIDLEMEVNIISS